MPNVVGRAVAPRERDSVVVSVRMPQRLYERVKQLAEADERSTAWMARRLIESALEHRERDGGGRGRGDDLRAMR